MSKQQFAYILRGIGLGLVIAAIMFLVIKDSVIEEAERTMSDAEIITEAKNLGMVDPYDITTYEMTDEEIIEKAKELGMEFIENGTKE